MKAEEIFLTVCATILFAPFAYNVVKFGYETIAGVLILVIETTMVATRLLVDFSGSLYRKILTKWENRATIEVTAAEAVIDDGKSIELDVLEGGQESEGAQTRLKRRARRRGKKDLS